MKIAARFLIVLSALCVPCAAVADEATPLLYTRTHIVIVHKTAQAQAATALPWQGSAADNSSQVFDVEVRDATILYNQKGWYNLSSPSEMSGVLLAFAAPTVSPIVRSTQYSPLDVLFIDKEGKIAQIIPDVMLSELEQEIYPDNPVLAFLFLKGGTCKKFDIAPGDEVEYKIFKKPPVVLSAPPPSATPPSSQPSPGQ